MFTNHLGFRLKTKHKKYFKLTLAKSKTQCYLPLVTSLTLNRDEMPAWDNHAPRRFYIKPTQCILSPHFYPKCLS